MTPSDPTSMARIKARHPSLLPVVAPLIPLPLVACASAAAPEPSGAGSAAGSASESEVASESRSEPGGEAEADEGEKKNEALADDTTLESPAGASFEAPASWFVTSHEGALELAPPERDLDLWLVDLHASSTTEAIDTAWKQVDPSFDREADQVVEPPPQGGWDEIRQVTYETSAEESRMILAAARRKEEITYVLLVRGPMAAFQRRGAQINQIATSLEPGALDKESFAKAEAKPLEGKRADELDSFIAEAMDTLATPGAAVAVVQGGEIVFERGYGVREQGGESITPETPFMIGSTTKALTSLMLALGVDREAFSWTTPVAQLLPSFALADPEMTKDIEIQHTMCACTGLPRQDMEFLFEYGDATPKDRLAELAAMKTTTDFGETFQYSNALVSAGGYAAARALTGEDSLERAYVRAMREKVLDPLGMKATTFRVPKGPRQSQPALPHGRALDGETERIPLRYEDAVTSVAPAGGAWSTVGDLARYMALELRGGVLPGGERLLSEETLFERRKARVATGDESAYGLALMLSDRRNLKRIGHNGNTLGFTSLLTFFPDHDLGIALVANAQGANALTGAVERKLVEIVLGGRAEAEDRVEFAARRRREAAESKLAKLSNPFEEGWGESLLGHYENDALGELALTREGDRLIVDAGEWRAAASRHTSGGSSALLLTEPPVAGLSFIPQDDGDLLLDVGQQQYTFSRP